MSSPRGARDKPAQNGGSIGRDRYTGPRYAVENLASRGDLTTLTDPAAYYEFGWRMPTFDRCVKSIPAYTLIFRVVKWRR
jgi:hypothetical protein